MRPFAALERFFERVFERPTARLFGARLQPIQLQRRLERAMENDRLTAQGRTLVPNRYDLHLHPEDLGSFGALAGSLASELADACLDYARRRRYTLTDRPQVTLVPDESVNEGEIRVESSYGRPRVEDGQPSEGDEPAADAPAGAGSGREGPFVAAPRPPVSDHTMVFEVPQVRSPRAMLRLVQPDGGQREVVVDGTPMTIGRATDNDLVLHDMRVSRHHARVQARSGSLVLTDIGSTNGTRVNGALVREVALGEGDTIELGDSRLIVESVPEP